MMHRTVRALATLSLSLTLSVLGGARVSSAQEMEHGSTRPGRHELQSNQIKTQQATVNTVIGNIRG